jgi:hypothetical protein
MSVATVAAHHPHRAEIADGELPARESLGEAREIDVAVVPGREPVEQRVAAELSHPGGRLGRVPEAG